MPKATICPVPQGEFLFCHNRSELISSVLKKDQRGQCQQPLAVGAAADGGSEVIRLPSVVTLQCSSATAVKSPPHLKWAPAPEGIPKHPGQRTPTEVAPFSALRCTFGCNLMKTLLGLGPAAFPPPLSSSTEDALLLLLLLQDVHNMA